MTQSLDPLALPAPPTDAPADGSPAPVGEVPPVPTDALAPPIEPPAPLPSKRGRFWHKLRLRPRALALVLRATAVLAITGGCLAAFVMQTTRTYSLHEFVNDNRFFLDNNSLNHLVRLQMLGWLGAGTLGGVVSALILLVRGSRPAAARIARTVRVSRLLSPLLVPGIALPLLAAQNWEQLQRIGGIALLALLAEQCVRASARELLDGRLAVSRWIARVAARSSERLARLPRALSPAIVLVALGTAFYAVWMSVFTIVQHRQFGTMAFDLGSYNTTFYNALHGHPFRSTAVLREGQDWSMLSNHAEFTMYALLPFYALRPGPETLLVLQSLALASGAIPLYRFAARRLPRGAASVLALAYLLYAPMHQANFYDIHFQPFAAAFTLWALDFLDGKRPVLFALFFLLALGCREDVPIGFAVVGVYLLLVGRRTLPGTIMLTVAIAYFVVVKFVVMPRFGSWWFSDLYKELYPPGETTYGGVVKTLLTNPAYVFKTLVTNDKMVFFLIVLTPIGFLPLRRGLLWMSLLPGAMFTLLTTGYGPTVDISFQYASLYIPFIFLASAIALATLGPSKQGRARLWGTIGGIVVATTLVSRVWGAMPPGDRFKGGFRDIKEFLPTTETHRQKARDIAELIAKIPPTASVAVSELEHPHVSTRLNVYTLRYGYEGAQFILYDEHSGGYGGDNGRKALISGEYELMEQRPSGMVLLKRRKQP